MRWAPGAAIWIAWYQPVHLASAMVTAPSQPGELVVSFVAQGTKIGGLEGCATLAYLQNVDSTTTLNNTSTSYAPAALGSSIGGLDDWQSIVVAIPPD